MEELTPRQQSLLRFIREYMGERGRPPVIREMARAIGVDLAATHECIRELHAAGYVYQEGSYRGWRPTRKAGPIPAHLPGLPVHSWDAAAGALAPQSEGHWPVTFADRARLEGAHVVHVGSQLWVVTAAGPATETRVVVSGESCGLAVQEPELGETILGEPRLVITLFEPLPPAWGQLVARSDQQPVQLPDVPQPRRAPRPPRDRRPAPTLPSSLSPDHLVAYSGLPTRPVNALTNDWARRRGIDRYEAVRTMTLRDLATYTEQDYLGLHQFGVQSWIRVRDCLSRAGLGMAGKGPLRRYSRGVTPGGCTETDWDELKLAVTELQCERAEEATSGA